MDKSLNKKEKPLPKDAVEIIHETKNLLLVKVKSLLEIHWFTGTHGVLVGSPKDETAGKLFMERAERYPQNLKKFLGL